jgi:hypothetical protein
VKPSTDLHSLINSLTPNEKGYFKKQCQKSGTASLKYLKLFDAVAAQKNYDEKALKKKLADPVLIRNLSSEKNYLYHLILEAVISGNFSQDPVLEMEMLLSKAKWLASHAFYENAMRFVKKVCAWSEENELFTLHLNALDLEWLLWQYLQQEERRPIEEIAGDRSKAIQKLALTDQLREIDIKVIRLFQETGIGREEAHLEKYRGLYNESQKIAASCESITVRAKTYLKNIAVFYHNVSGEAEKSLGELNALINLLDANKALKRERLSFYLSSLNNLILLQLHLGKYEEAKNTIALLESINPETQSQRNTVFIIRYNTGFDLYNYLRDFNSAYHLSQELKKEIAAIEDKIDNRYTGHIRFAAFRACFYAGHLKEALQWINQIVQKPEGEPFKSELLTIARISELVIHETMEHYDLLERLTESAGRFLNKTNSLYHFEKLMLDFFHEQLKIHPEKKALLNLQKQLEEIEKDSLEERAFLYFDFRAWVKARIHGCEIAVVLEKTL